MIPLASGARALVNVAIEATSPGQGSVLLNLHATAGGGTDRQVSFKLITPDTKILLVDDGDAATFETTWFAPAIGATGKSFAVWDRNSTAITAADLANFDIVVWSAGLPYPTVDDMTARPWPAISTAAAG